MAAASAWTSGFGLDLSRAFEQRPRSIAPKYFYDAEGSRLFERICETPEYYPTRTEMGILDACAADIAAPSDRMPTLLIVEQLLNGLQFGLMLFLLAAGLTLVFGIMDMINLAHGSLYMVGAYLAATASAATGSFTLGLLAGVAGAALFGALLEVSILRRLYTRDHLSQVLGTFAILLMCNEAVRMVWEIGRASCRERVSSPV